MNQLTVHYSAQGHNDEVKNYFTCLNGDRPERKHLSFKMY